MDEVLEAIKQLAKDALDNDKRVLQVVDILIGRYLETEKQVQFLMELHKVEENDVDPRQQKLPFPKIRSMSIIGDLWPICKFCSHIAQEHDTDGCTGGRTRCSCRKYIGPTLQEFGEKYLTEEERRHYNWEKRA